MRAVVGVMTGALIIGAAFASLSWSKRTTVNMWQAVQASLVKRQAFVRNAGAAAVLFVGADAVAQYVEARDKHNASNDGVRNRNSNSSRQETPFALDQWRCMGATVLGVLLGGGVYPAAYAQLDRFLPGRSWRTIVIKSAVEIATVGIFVNTASLLGRASWQGTHTWSAVGEHVTNEIPRVTLMDARVWFPYNLLAFGLIPIQVRPLTTACMEAGWQTYISLRAHDYQQEEGGELLLLEAAPTTSAL